MYSSRCTHRTNSCSPALPRRPPSPKLRFDAYVCTAAERGYALEAWRVLDPDGWMIPLDQRELGMSSGVVERVPAECSLLCTVQCALLCCCMCCCESCCSGCRLCSTPCVQATSG